MLSESIGITQRSSNPAHLYGYPGDTLYVNNGAILGMRDVQFGTFHPERQSMLNGDIGAGCITCPDGQRHPGVLNLGADVSKAVRIQASGKTVLRAQDGRMKVCDEKGCLDLMRALRRLQGRVSR